MWATARGRATKTSKASEETSVEILQPKNYYVSGDIIVRAVAKTTHGFPEGSKIAFSVATKDSSFTPPEVSCQLAGPPGRDHLNLNCWFVWDTSGYEGKEAVISATITDSDGNNASAKRTIFVTARAALSVRITEPDSGETVSGQIKISATASGPNLFNQSEKPIHFKIQSASKTETKPAASCLHFRTEPAESKLALTSGIIYGVTCSLLWDTSGQEGEAEVTAIARDSKGNEASHTVNLFVAQIPTGQATLRVKAFDSETSEPVEATTIILRLSRTVPGHQVPVGQPDKPLEIPSGGSSPIALTTRGPYSATVIGTIQANGQDSEDLEEGSYYLITFSKGYTLSYYWNLVVRGGEEFNLRAPMSTDQAKPSPEKPKPPAITQITESSGQRVVKIKTEVLDEEVEVLSGKGKITVIPEPSGKSRFVLITGDSKALTKEVLELVDNKLYIKSGELKTQLKVLPDKASEKVTEALSLYRIRDIHLAITEESPVYLVRGDQKASILGFIPAELDMSAEVNGETGEIIKINRPFWAFLAVPRGS